MIGDEDGGFSRGNYQTEGIAARPVEEEYDRKFFQQLIRNTSIHSNPVRKIVFRIRSHDQGWTTDERTGPFIDAKTWFEAGLERFDASHECKFNFPRVQTRRHLDVLILDLLKQVNAAQT